MVAVGSTVYRDAVLADSPSVFYRLSDAASPAVFDAGAGGVNATVAGSVTFAQTGGFPGSTATAVSFPGTATNYLQTVSSPGSAYDLGDGPFSIECWFKLGATLTLMDLLGKQGSACYVIRIDATGKLSLAASGVGNCFIATTAVTDTNWHHLVVTRVAATSPIMYLDGSSVAGTYTARTFADSTSQFDMGRSGTANYYNGLLQDVALYKSVLSPTRVTAHYNAGINSVNGTAALTTKKFSVSAAGYTATDTGTVLIFAKKSSIVSITTLTGTALVHAKKATISVLPRLVAHISMTAKKATIVSAPTTTGTVVQTAKKAKIFASQSVSATVVMTTKKPSIAALRRTLVAVRVNDVWANCIVWARVGNAWVSCVPKVMIDGVWYTIDLGPHGVVRQHVDMQMKRPTIHVIGANLTLHGTVAMTMKRPVFSAKQSFVTTGTVAMQMKRPTLNVHGKPPPSSMLLGVNNYTGSPATVHTWDDYVSVIPNCSVTRVYNQGSDGPNGIPDAWPHSSFTIVAAMKHLVVSIRPTDIAGFIAGTYDAATKVWLRKIPEGQYICAYHEANLAANIFQTTLGGTAAQFRAMSQKLRDLARAVEAEDTSNPKLNVGIIIGSANIGIDNTPWIPTGMDWYGMDGYGGAKSVLPSQRFGPNVSAITTVQPGAKMAIIENNDKTAVDATRWNLWFTDAFQYALDNNMIIFMTWWGPTAQYPNAEIFNTSGTYVPTLHDLYASI